MHLFQFERMGSLSFLHKVLTFLANSCRPEKHPVKVLITGATGQIGYALVPMVARGFMLGPDQPVILHLHDIPSSREALDGIKLELIDAAFPLLRGIVATTDMSEAFNAVDVAIMIGGFPGKNGVLRNAPIYKDQAVALEHHAAKNCKVVVIANPVNTNALILKEHAPSIPKKNITCLTRHDHNRALAQLAEKLDVHPCNVKNVVVWGNQSSTMYPYVNHATVATDDGVKGIREALANDQWLGNDFITSVRERGGATGKASRLSSSRGFSAASAACDHVRDWIDGTPKGTWVSMGVCSDGSYGIPEGLIYSFPVTCEKGEWSIVQGLQIDDNTRLKMDAAVKELSEEKTLAYSRLV